LKRRREIKKLRILMGKRNKGKHEGGPMKGMRKERDENSSKKIRN
jgi:hypothetical protein